MITLDQLRQIMPYAGHRADVFCLPLNQAADEFSITTPQRASMWLANICVESGSLRYVEELASGDAYDNRDDLGNTTPEAIAIAAQHGSTPGQWFKGHGLGQVTGYFNHRLCSQELFNDPELLLHHPEVLLQPLPAARSAGWFWWRNQLWRYADAGDFDGCCDVWNIGHKTKKEGDSNGYQERLAAYNRAQSVMNPPPFADSGQ